MATRSGVIQVFGMGPSGPALTFVWRTIRIWRGGRWTPNKSTDDFPPSSSIHLFAMPRFNLSAIITVSAFCEVEADSLEEAIEKSQSLPPAYHSIGSGTDPEENWCVEEIDGEPVEITGEECQANA
jgi:hypothetical protein